VFGDLIWLILGILFYGTLIGYLAGLVPAAILMARRKSWAYFWAGFITLGLAWYFGASQILDVKARSVLIVAGCLFLIGFICARPAVILGVDGETLQTSVGTFMTEGSECLARGDDWVCDRYDMAASGGIPYLVKVDRLGCWDGRSLTPVYGGELKIEGCVNVIDMR